MMTATPFNCARISPGLLLCRLVEPGGQEIQGTWSLLSCLIDPVPLSFSPTRVMARCFVLLLLTTGCCRGLAETGVGDRLKTELKEVFPYAPSAVGEEKPALSGEPGQKGEPTVVTRSPAYKPDSLTTALRAAAAKAALKLPALGRDAGRSDLAERVTAAGSPANQGAAGNTESGAAAAKDSRPGHLPTGAPDAAEADVLILPKVEITAKKGTKLEAQLAEIDQQQRGEEKNAETTWLDDILNPPFLNLGGASGNSRAAIARRRIEVLGWVKILTISLKEAKTPEEKARIQAEIDGLKEITRHWP